MDKNDIEQFEIFPWNESFDTGIEIIDEQHKRLVGILNDLATHLSNLSSYFYLNEIFNELTKYADYHFKTEEKIWAAVFKNDSWYASHQKTHKAFIDEIIELKNNPNNKPIDNVIYDIVSFLTQWLIYHILDTDKRMAKVVLEIQAGNSFVEAKIISTNEMSGSVQELINTILLMYDKISYRTLALLREKILHKRAEEKLYLSEERWKFILEGKTEDVWDWDIENDKLESSDKNDSVFEIISNELVRYKKGATIHPSDIEYVKSDFKNHLDGKTEFFTCKYRVLYKNNGWSWVLSRGKVISRSKDGKALRMIGTHSDITERELASLIYKNSSQGMFICDNNNNIISTNPAFSIITGYSEEEVVGKNPKILASKKHDKLFHKRIWEELNTYGKWNGEIWNKRKNGEIFPEMLSINVIKNSFGVVDHYVALFSDIKEQKIADKIIIEKTYIDTLTKLPNLSMFQMNLEQEVHRSAKFRLSFALLFVDLDYFKEVNDKLGHQKGDIILVEVSERIVHQLRETDIIARFGGDKFTIILPLINDSTDIEHIAKNIIDSISKSFQIDTEDIYISASIGISIYPNDSKNAIELLKNAEQAMYEAKKIGRNCFKFSTVNIQNKAKNRHEILSDLHKAVEENQFQVYYQPIIDLKTKKINKAEALIRWNHPTRGLISPTDFIPLAEQSGLIVPIGDWVYKETVRQTSKWKEKYNVEFQISVNKSPLQFKSASKLENWIDYLTEYGLSGRNTIIEITEGLLMELENIVAVKLLQLRDASIEIALDDFGTGYSSLSYLKKFDIDYIKIDQSFINNLAHDSQDVILCEAMIVMAHKLDIKVIAEGIETELQRSLISKMDCDFGQGYFFSKPIPAEEFEKLFVIPQK